MPCNASMNRLYTYIEESQGQQNHSTLMWQKKGHLPVKICLNLGISLPSTLQSSADPVLLGSFERMGRPISIKQVSCHQWLSVVLLMMGHNRNHFDRWSDERVLRFGFLAVHRWRHVMENILERKEWDDELRPDKSLYWKNKLVLYSSILDSSTLIIEFS